LHKFYVKLALLSKKESDIHCSHSIDAAEELTIEKSKWNKHVKKHHNGHTSRTKSNN